MCSSSSGPTVEPWPHTTSSHSISRFGTECALAPSDRTRLRLVSKVDVLVALGQIFSSPVKTDSASSSTAPFRKTSERVMIHHDPVIEHLLTISEVEADELRARSIADKIDIQIESTHLRTQPDLTQPAGGVTAERHSLVHGRRRPAAE